MDYKIKYFSNLDIHYKGGKNKLTIMYMKLKNDVDSFISKLKTPNIKFVIDEENGIKYIYLAEKEIKDGRNCIDDLDLFTNDHCRINEFLVFLKQDMEDYSEWIETYNEILRGETSKNIYFKQDNSYFRKRMEKTQSKLVSFFSNKYVWRV
jgi:hypothetical protein